MDYHNSVDSAERKDLYAEGAVSFFLHEQDYDSAWGFLTALGNESDESKFLRAATEYHHASVDDRKHHVVRMRELADEGIERAVEARFHCVQWAIDLGDYELARTCISSEFQANCPLQAQSLLGWIELECGDLEKAQEHAKRALDASSQSASREEIAVLARLLMQLNEDEKALPLLEKVYTPGVLDLDCKRLIDCARFLDRHDILIRVCAELRKTDQQDNKTRKLEVQVLSHYAPDEAYELAKQFLVYDRSYFLVAKNFIACRLQKTEEIEFDTNSSPRPQDFAPEEADQVLIPYVETGKYREALEFLYQQLRMNFSNELSHGKYMWFIVQYGTKCEIDAPKIVNDDCAVQLKNLVTDEYRWVSIEDHQPDKARKEFSSSSDTAKAVLGKRVGDTVEIFALPLQRQREEIIEIQSKYVRLFQDVMGNFKKNFPDSTSMQPIHVGSGEDFDISPILESARQRREYVENALEFYRNNPCALHVLAERFGINQRQLIKGLAQSEEEILQCVGFTPEAFIESVKGLSKAEAIVLDVSAIITIALLDGWDKLAPDREYLISQSTLELVTAWLHDLTKKDSQPAAYSTYSDDGKLLLQEVSEEYLENERSDLEKIVGEIGNRCSTRTSKSLAEIEPSRRTAYIDVFGYPTLEALSVAKDEDAAFWSDDRFVGMIAEADFSVKRVWSQLAFKTFQNIGHVSISDYSRITAKLSAWKYLSTIWGPRDIVSAGALCNWEPSAWPFKQCIQLINQSEMSLPRKAHVALDFFKFLRESECGELRQTPVIQAMLDSLDSRQAAEWLHSQMDDLFLIDISSATYLKLQIEYWLRLR